MGERWTPSYLALRRAMSCSAWGYGIGLGQSKNPHQECEPQRGWHTFAAQGGRQGKPAHGREQGLWWISRSANHASMQIRHIFSQGDGVLDAIVLCLFPLSTTLNRETTENFEAIKMHQPLRT